MSSVRATGAQNPWTEGRVPGHEVAALTFALLLTFTVLNLALSGRLSLLYDLAFVTLCAVAGLSVRPRDFFAVAVLPPLAMLSVVAILAIADREAIAQPHDGFVQATISGLSTHALALGFGYALCLGALALRREFIDEAAD